jgi:hypothetical protein
MEKFDVLLTKISELRNLYKDKGDFNVLHSIGFSSQETMHSRFISTLLDPKAQHGQGSRFLNLFIKHSRLHFNIDNVEIRIEKPAKKRRMDITVENKTNNSILVIENKIWAKDQNRQLADYYDDCKGKCANIVLVYLTPYGHHPSYISLGENLTLDKVNCISYEKTIIPWIHECSEIAEGRLKSSLEMYNEILHKLINRDKYMNEIFKCLTEDKEKLKLAIDISSALQGRNFINVYENTLPFLVERINEIIPSAEAQPYPDDDGCPVVDITLGEFSCFIRFEDSEAYLVNRLNNKTISLFCPSNIYDEKLRSLIFEEVEIADEWISKLFDQIRNS